MKSVEGRPGRRAEEGMKRGTSKRKEEVDDKWLFRNGDVYSKRRSDK